MRQNYLKRDRIPVPPAHGQLAVRGMVHHELPIQTRFKSGAYS